MTYQNVAGYGAQARTLPREVFFTAGTALIKGQGLCYDRDRGTAGDIDETRDKYVELPTTSNHRWFAGVTAAAHTARTGGQWIKIYEPGSVCEVAVLEDTTIDTGLIGCIVSDGGRGRFGLGGLLGPGAAIPLQTKTDNNHGVLTTGADGAALDSTGLILTHSGQSFLSLNKSGSAGTDIKAGSRLIVLVGEDDGSKFVTAGDYTIASTTSATVLVTDSVVSDGGTMEISYYAVAGNPTTLCYLVPGNGHLISGCVEWLPLNNGASQSMVAGTSFYMGGSVRPGGNVTTTLADGAYPGEEKMIALRGSIATDSLIVTVTSGGVVIAGTASTLATTTLNSAEESTILKWGYDGWGQLTLSTGAANA